MCTVFSKLKVPISVWFKFFPWSSGKNVNKKCKKKIQLKSYVEYKLTNIVLQASTLIEGLLEEI